MKDEKREAAIARQYARQEARRQELLDNPPEDSRRRYRDLWHIPRYLKSVAVRHK